VEIYLEASPGKPCVNLISVIDVERLDPPFSVSRLIKTSDGKPLKTTRTTAGGWSVVYDSGTPIEKGVVEAELQAEVAKSLNDDDTARQQRLATATKKPQVIQVVSRAFRRNADVIAVVSKRANGICEECHSPAPFHRASNDTPYLEVHHRIMLSAGGEDTVANALALCPNCHRKLHFGKSDTPSEA
jgi:5-methylcytosine-specific restriction protein A